MDESIVLPNVGAPDDFSAEKLGMVPRMQGSPVIIDAIPDATSPAAQAGLQKDDIILSVDGHELHSSVATSAYLKDMNGKPVILKVQRSGLIRTISIQPRLMPAQDGTEQYRLGFAPVPPPVVTTHQPLGRALATGWHDFAKSSMLIFDVIGGMFKHQVSVRNLSGPVGIAQQVGLAQQLGSWTVLALMAGISLNLGIFNLLPMPVLDGGMILFLVIESIMRRDVNARVKERIYQAAFVCILLFAVFVIFNDITKLPIFTHKPS